ncbi:MAG: complex I subunit 4 family protein [Chloroflexota bacterium]
MIPAWLIIIPSIAAVLAWITGRWGTAWPRWISLLALAANLALAVALWAQQFGQGGFTLQGPWLAELNVPWIPQFGIGFHLALDGLSLLLVTLTSFLGIMAVAASWTEIRDRVGFFHFNLLWVLAAITGVFLAIDLFLFYFFWEMMLIPSYFLFLWGFERRLYAAIKFIIFTQAGGLLMLLAILGLYFLHGQGTGSYSFDYMELLGTRLPQDLAMWLMLGLFVGFAVKLPVVPIHTWLPDAYTQAPTGASVVLSGLMAKTAGYGLIRFLVPLFPQAALSFAPVAMVLAVAGILYGTLLAFGQRDLKRLIAYSSLSHMGFVLLGIFAWNSLALQGVVMVMVAHGVSTGALFILAGALQQRVGTREMARMGGLWSTVPLMGGATLFFALASLGLPGLGNFVGEFLTLLGTFRANFTAAVLAAIGIVFATVYALWMIQRVFQGPNREGWQLPDLSSRELGMMVVLIVTLLWLGLYPQPVLNAAGQGLSNVQRYAASGQAEAWRPLLGKQGAVVPEGGAALFILQSRPSDTGGRAQDPALHVAGIRPGGGAQDPALRRGHGGDHDPR